MPKLAPEAQAARRDHILDAAEACFARAGFHRTSMQDICREAGVSAGALYTWFSSKEELIAGLVEREKQRFTSRLAEVAASPDLIAALRSFAEHCCCEEPREKLWLHVEIGAEATRNEALAQIVHQMDDFVRESFAALLSEAKAEGRIDPSFDIQTIVRILAVLADGLFWHRAIDPGFDPREALPVLMSVVSGLINPVPGDAQAGAPEIERVS